MRRVLLISLLVIVSLPLTSTAQTVRTGFDPSNYGVSVKPDKRLIVVLSSLEVAGIETPLSSKGEEFRATLRNDLKNISPDLQQKLRSFIGQYKKRYTKKTPSELVAPFIALAHSLSETPNLAPPERSVDLPDDLLEVLDYASLVAEFYKSPGVAEKIAKYHVLNTRMSDDVSAEAKVMVREVLDYLHTRPQLTYTERIKTEIPGKKKKKKLTRIETVVHQRSFTVTPDFLVPKKTVNFLNVRDKYIVVVSPDIDLSLSEARRAYLQFVLDPLVFDNVKEIIDRKDGIRKLLENLRENNKNVSPDVVLAVSRSLVAAADVREEEFRRVRAATGQARAKIELLKSEDEKRAVVAELNRVKQIFADEAALQLSESYERGAVLAFYFSGKLKGIEDSGFDVGNSIGDWIQAMTPETEANRLQEFAEARDRAVAERKKRNTKTIVETTLIRNPLTEALLEIDKDIELKNLVKAEADLKALLARYPKSTSRIYYSLGRVASLSAENLENRHEVNKKLIEAKNYFERVIRFATPATDKEMIALTYVSLGGIYEFYDQKDYAVKIYDAAMKFGRADGEGYKKAFAAKQKLVEKN